ncbi:MAG TPA: copper chaperone PCu(A)C [Candidatus Limnocylindrales bacterium]|nr:copper chaperone PCu(A)C [Candidatus Limnocylindrales bacterium]
MSIRRSVTVRPFRVALAAVIAAAVLGACSSAAAPSAGAMRVEDAWARPSMGMDRAAAAYLVVVNDTGVADALVGARSPAAATVELHETAADASGQMAMHPIDRIDLPVGGRAALEPGGTHIMLIDLTGDLVAGQQIDLTLDFATAPDLVVKATVRAS